MLPIKAPTQTAGQGQLVLFLSVMLLILDFFILIQSMSTFEDVKKDAIMSHIDLTFNEQSDLVKNSRHIASRIGAILAPPKQLATLGDLFQTAVPVAKIYKPDYGAQLVITLPLSEIFKENSTELIDKQIGLINRVADVLKNKTDTPYKATFLINQHHTQLDLDRAVFMGEYFSTFDIPLGVFSVGVDESQPGWAEFIFSAV